MQRFTLAAALLAASVATAKAETVWIGNGFIDFVGGSATCTNTFSVGDSFRLQHLQGPDIPVPGILMNNQRRTMRSFDYLSGD